MLQDYRKQIDKLDKKLIEILAERFSVTHEVGLYKKENNLPPLDAEREKEMMEKRTKFSEALGLDEDFIIEIFRLITSKSKQNHRKIIDNE